MSDDPRDSPTYEREEMLRRVRRFQRLSGSTQPIPDWHLRSFGASIRARAARWGVDNTDPELDSVYRHDRADLEHIAALVEAGEVESAARAIGRVDTIVRELIPSSVYATLIAASPDPEETPETAQARAPFDRQGG